MEQGDDVEGPPAPAQVAHLSPSYYTHPAGKDGVFLPFSPLLSPSGSKRWGTVKKNTFKNEKKKSGFVARGHPVAGTALLSIPTALKV